MNIIDQWHNLNARTCFKIERWIETGRQEKQMISFVRQLYSSGYMDQFVLMARENGLKGQALVQMATKFYKLVYPVYEGYAINPEILKRNWSPLHRLTGTFKRRFGLKVKVENPPTYIQCPPLGINTVIDEIIFGAVSCLPCKLSFRYEPNNVVIDNPDSVAVGVVDRSDRIQHIAKAMIGSMTYTFNQIRLPVNSVLPTGQAMALIMGKVA